MLKKYGLRLIIFFLILAQALIVFTEDTIVSILYVIVALFILLFYSLRTNHHNGIGLVAFALFVFGTCSVYFHFGNEVLLKVISFMASYAIISYFAYQNNKAFDFSRRDIFTILLGSSLYTLIFFLMFTLLQDLMGVLKIWVLLYLLLLHALLIVAGLHYVNIRSEKSMLFFLMMLSFVLSDFCYFLDHFYMKAEELQLLHTLYNPLALYFFVNYLKASELSLKSNALENF